MVITVSAYDADAVFWTVRSSWDPLLETMTRGDRLRKTVEIVAAMATVVAVNAQPSWPRRTSRAVVAAASTPATGTSPGMTPPLLTDWVQRTKTSTARAVSGAERRATVRARSRTS